MATTYERLSALDASFLGLEDSNIHQHVGGTFLFDAGPVRTPEGGIDIVRIRKAIEARLHLVPRFRQRIAAVPYENHPIWVDDDRFRIHYHVRHTALPKPGDERGLKRLVARIMSQALDRGRPLWEMWFVEGLDGDRFALITKTHHCMIDGVSGADLMSIILSPFPDPETGEPEAWQPRPRPSDATLGWDAVTRRLGQPVEALQAISGAVRRPAEALGRIGDAAAAIRDALAPALSPTSETPLNVPVGPHRRVDWIEMRVADLKQVKSVLGGTLNDVVLATVTGALRRFLEKRGVDPKGLEIRTLIPVSVRSEGERGALGNRVAQIIAPLPIGEPDPRRRLEAVSRTMSGLKESKQALGAEVLTAISDWTVPNLLVQALRLAQASRPFNLMVTNVPGPQIPLYFLGCEMRTAYPVVTLFPKTALAVGLFSFNGGLFWCLTADWEQMPDLHDFIGLLDESFRELQRAAGQKAGGKSV